MSHVVYPVKLNISTRNGVTKNSTKEIIVISNVTCTYFRFIATLKQPEVTVNTKFVPIHLKKALIRSKYLEE